MFSEAPHNAAVKLIECLMSTPLPPREIQCGWHGAERGRRVHSDLLGVMLIAADTWAG